MIDTPHERHTTVKVKQAQASTLHLATGLSRAMSAALSFLALLAFTATPALAFETHNPLPFSPITGSGTGTTIKVAAGVAVDETNGNIFLHQPLGPVDSTIDIFGAEGGVPSGLLAPFQISGLVNENGENSDATITYSGIAVDNSAASPNQGTLYVSEVTTPRRVRKFVRNAGTEKYEAAGELKAKTPAFGAATGLAVDSNGDVFVADPGSRSVVKFGPTGTQLARVSTEPLKAGINVYGPSDVDIDSAGDLFVVVQRENNPEQASSKVVKYAPNGSGEFDQNDFTVVYTGDVSAAEDNARSIAVDPVTNSLYVVLSSFTSPDRVLQYDATTLQLKGEFGSGVLTVASHITVNSATGNIYVADKRFNPAKSTVAVFGPGVKLPTVTAKAPTNVIGARATLNATVNAESIALTECKFEYGPTSSYGTSVPCEGAVPTDANDHAVTAKITSLTPSGVTYHFRISVTNANGTNLSPDQSFLSGPPAVTETATDVTGAKATLHGTVLPLNLAVTECKFEYGPTIAYGKSASCLESVPADNGEHTVSADIAHLLPNGATYHFRITTDGAAGPQVGQDETLDTADTFLTGTATFLTGTTATLGGSVKLEGDLLTDCSFEYGTSISYGASVSCSPLFSSIPDDAAAHAISGSAVGLTPETTYHFRLVAKNANGTIHGADQTFKTKGPPLVTGQSAVPIGTSEAALEGWINPNGTETTYHFEWGVDSSYGSKVPVDTDPSIGSGVSSVKVTASLSGLEEEMTYHYRVVATSALGTTDGPDQTFTTELSSSACANAAIRSGQTSEVNPDGTSYLPDCMALEMVSPPKKYNQKVSTPALSATGDAVSFNSLAALADTPLLEFIQNEYVSTRTESGWVTHATQPPISLMRYATLCNYSSDLSHWTHKGTDPLQKTATVRLSTGGIDGRFSLFGPTLRQLNYGAIGATCDGTSADMSRIFFGITESGYLPGDPMGLHSHNLYEAHLDDEGQASVKLLARDEDGKVWGASCGAVLGAIGPFNNFALRGAVSPDGSRVYFTSNPTQPEDTSCDAGANRKRVMKRIDAPGGPEISVLSTSECSRVSPSCNLADGDDNFRAASREGDKVFFTTSRQLADTDLDTGTKCDTTVGSSAGCDLYLYDASRPTGARLTQISAGDAGDPTPGKDAEVLGVVEVSGDGSHTYFVAAGALSTAPNERGRAPEAGRPNLYLYERDAAHPGGRTKFIATMESSDDHGTWSVVPGSSRAIAVPMLGADVEDQAVGGDGHILFFNSNVSMTADDTDGGKNDIYRYDSDSGSLQRITRAAPGGSDNGAFDVDQLTGVGGVPAPQSGRRVSEDGQTIVFSTAEALDPADTDGQDTDYIWHDGQLISIPGSLVGENFIPGIHPTVSMSGREVAFISHDQLLGVDGDGTTDVYVARADGGFEPPPAPDPCEGEACQNSSDSQPIAPIAPSESLQGAGNVKAKPPTQCRKGTHKVKRKGKVRCVKPRHAKANRRAGK